MRRAFIPALAIAMLSISSCSKLDKNTSTVTPIDIPTATSLSTLFSSVAPQPKTASIDATTGGSFVGNSGARYVFPPNGFRTASGASVTGTVTIQATEFLKKSDMIFSGVLPVSDGSPLISGGETYVKASQGSQEVFMKRGSMYQVNFPQKSTPVSGMDLFFSGGTFKTTASVTNWQINRDSTRGGISYNGDTISIFTDSMHFINADKFMSMTGFQNFNITLSAGGQHIIDEAVMAYAVFDTYNSVLPIYSISGGVLTVGLAPGVPVHFVVGTIINNQFYAAMMGVSPTSGTNYNMTLTKMTPQDLKVQIDAL